MRLDLTDSKFKEVAATVVAGIVLLWLGIPLFLHAWLDDKNVGTFAALFQVPTALFSALALIAAGTAVVFQHHQLLHARRVAAFSARLASLPILIDLINRRLSAIDAVNDYVLALPTDRILEELRARIGQLKASETGKTKSMERKIEEQEDLPQSEIQKMLYDWAQDIHQMKLLRLMCEVFEERLVLELALKQAYDEPTRL